MITYNFINPPKNITDFTIQLPTSKSESNRILVMKALASFQNPLHCIRIEHLSTARDTSTMRELLNFPEQSIWDVKDAGTTMRFLTAFLAVTKQEKTLTGTQRMQERPIGILVEALKSLGYAIQYLKKEGYPPLKFEGKKSDYPTNYLQIRGDVSSQYISALLMIAPLLPQGLTLELLGTIASKPYLALTLALMQKFGIQYQWEGNQIHIPAQTYQGGNYAVAPDWSAASYWYSLASFLPDVSIKLPRLSLQDLQGDKVIATMMQYWGVETTENEKGISIRKTKPIQKQIPLLDFSDCPDLAQTIVVVAAAHQTRLQITGLESLRIKETDRIFALQTELSKIGGGLTTQDNKIWTVEPAQPILPENVSFDTYDDHRMAMAFAPLSVRVPIQIENPAVVAKSYPHFWEDWTTAGFAIEQNLFF